VGVWQGYTLLAGMAGNPGKRCIGVDNFSEYGGPRDEFIRRFNIYKSSNHFFYDMDYQDYLSTCHEGRIGFYIYDGEHNYEHQLAGLQLAEPFFSDDCVILIDDSNLDITRQATEDFIAESKHGYRIILDRPTSRNGHPSFWNGVMILGKTS
jgi:cephalosporin hydroxylase